MADEVERQAGEVAGRRIAFGMLALAVLAAILILIVATTLIGRWVYADDDGSCVGPGLRSGVPECARR